MPILYHYKLSAFSRRARLALAFKGVKVELREARAVAAFGEEAKKLSPSSTMPVLVDGDIVIGDSTALTHYLDRAFAGEPLWPTNAAEYARALHVVAQVNVAQDSMADLGTRYYPLRNDPAWGDVAGERLRRVALVLESLEKTVGSRMYTASDSWSVADIWLATYLIWVSDLPGRAGNSPSIANLLSLGVRLPAGLVVWVAKHRERADIAALAQDS